MQRGLWVFYDRNHKNLEHSTHLTNNEVSLAISIETNTDNFHTTLNSKKRELPKCHPYNRIHF